MKCHPYLHATVIFCATLTITTFITGCTQNSRALNDHPQTATAKPDSKPVRHLYAGAGLGVSKLVPDTSEAGNASVNDKYNGSGQITIGADLNKHLSVEVHSADLGSAGLAPAGRINYHVNGASALYYLGKNRQNYRRQGWTGFARIGYGQLENTPVGDVDFTNINASHTLYGVGAEYATRYGLGIRAELVSYDTDIQHMQLGMIYRSGKNVNSRSLPIPVAQAPKAEIFISTHTPEPTIAAALSSPQLADTDADGVVDAVDTCAQTPRAHIVDEDGCTLAFEPVYFATDSAELNITARAKLSKIAATLTKYPRVSLSLSAHTDDRGEDNYNHGLAARRSQSVVDFLAGINIASKRLLPTSYGEKLPADSNLTTIGRQRNRRVDIAVIAE